jgi:hypothetical protein
MFELLTVGSPSRHRLDDIVLEGLKSHRKGPLDLKDIMVVRAIRA